MKANNGLQILGGHIFATALSKDLEGQDLLLLYVEGDKLCVKNEVLDLSLKLRHIVFQKLYDVRIGNSQVFQVA